MNKPKTFVAPTSTAAEHTRYDKKAKGVAKLSVDFSGAELDSYESNQQIEVSQSRIGDE